MQVQMARDIEEQSKAKEMEVLNAAMAGAEAQSREVNHFVYSWLKSVLTLTVYALSMHC